MIEHIRNYSPDVRLRSRDMYIDVETRENGVWTAAQTYSIMSNDHAFSSAHDYAILEIRERSLGANNT